MSRRACAAALTTSWWRKRGGERGDDCNRHRKKETDRENVYRQAETNEGPAHL